MLFNLSPRHDKANSGLFGSGGLWERRR